MYETPPTGDDPLEAQHTHRGELRLLAGFSLSLLVIVGATYFVPQAEAVRPWLPGETVPLVHFLDGGTKVQEDVQGDLVVKKVAQTKATDGAVLTSTTPGAAPVVKTPPPRPPAVPTPLEAPDGALDSWFAELAKAEAGLPGVVVRTLHWGDSTIAGDGITMTVRDRLQDRFGNGGPGFLAVAVDPRWSIRPGIARWTKGDWESLSITFGGAEQPRYGLSGTVATATEEATATLGGNKLPDADSNSDRELVHRIDLFYQVQPGGGGIYMKPRGAGGAGLSTDSGSDRRWDAFHMLTSTDGSPTVWLKADGSGPVTLYGVALETNGPGLTWESFGVAGSGQGSILNNQSRGHLAGQVERRQPHLLVFQTGGNELGYPSLKVNEGKLYAETYGKVLDRLRAGAPDAACLVVTPLDQATKERGEVLSKPMLTRMIALQRQAAFDQGCAFWDARAAMGGEGAFSRWLDNDPRLAWTDLMHLTDEGLELVGHTLADAVELAYDDWKAANPDALPQAWQPPAVVPPAPDSLGSAQTVSGEGPG